MHKTMEMAKNRSKYWMKYKPMGMTKNGSFGAHTNNRNSVERIKIYIYVQSNVNGEKWIKVLNVLTN